MKTAEIYLDMDGVCVDFLGAALKCQGYDPQEYFGRWLSEHRGELFPEALIGKTPVEFFTNPHMQTADFWTNLVAYEWFERLYAELGRLGNVIFLTAPISSPGCVQGKHQWLINQFGSDFDEFIFTRHKERLAHDNAFLVDDMPFNIAPFTNRQGHGLLFPQIWNDYAGIEDPVSQVIEELDRILITA